jgi:zinc transport system ATP-binding protein
MTVVLEADDVVFAYGETTVLDGVSLTVRSGEFVALAGGNGSGKSTLLRVLLGLLQPQRGSARLFGEPSTSRRDRWRIGYVPQRPVVHGDLPATVHEVVIAGRLARRGWRRLTKDDRAATEQAIADVGLSDHAGRRFAELSGGQQQRALIAKAIVNDPELLILDEPIAGVDTEAQALFRDALVTRIDAGRAVLLVSHELSAVADDLDRVVVLANAKVRFDGPPGDLERSGVSLGVHRHDLPAWLEEQH